MSQSAQSIQVQSHFDALVSIREDIVETKIKSTKGCLERKVHQSQTEHEFDV